MRTAIERVWTYWVPLDKQTIRHVPVVLHDVLHKGGYFQYSIIDLQHIYSSYTLSLSMGNLRIILKVTMLDAL
jgi:hypothetical protein